MAERYVTAFAPLAESPPMPKAAIAAAPVAPADYRPKVIRGTRFANQKVLLDGYEYDGCEFVNVTFDMAVETRLVMSIWLCRSTITSTVLLAAPTYVPICPGVSARTL